MNNLIEAEWYKLRKNGTFRTLIFFVIALTFSYLLITYLNFPKNGGYEITLTGIELYVNALAINQFILQIFLGILAGFFISSEYSYGVLKRTASVGNDRRQIYISKLGIYSLGVVMVSLMIPILTVLIGSLMAGAGLLSEFGQPTDSSTMEYVLRTLGFTILFAAAFASIAAFIAVMLEDAGKTIGFSIVFFLFVDQILRSLGNYVPFLKKVYDYSLFNLFRKTTEYTMDNKDLILSILMPSLTLAAFVLLGIYAFRKKDIQ